MYGKVLPDTKTLHDRMPPRDGTALAADARKALLTWLVCGAKND